MRDVLTYCSDFRQWNACAGYAAELATTLGASLTGLHAGQPLPVMPAAGNVASGLAEWMADNAEKRGAHHHVFNALRAAQMIDYAGCEILDVEIARPSDIYVIARKPVPGIAFSNARFLDRDAPYLRTSPFPSDRAAH